MLVEFIVTHRDNLIARTRAKVAERLAPTPTQTELSSGVSLFLDQLVQALRRAGGSTDEEMDADAAVHGAALLGRGYTAAQVVHDYGDICQAITEAAEELDAPITTDEFHTLNRCLDNAIAGAVTEYTRLRDETIAAGETERSGVLAHELRNKLSAAQLGFLAITSGRAPNNGSVARVVTRSLRGMTALVNRSMVEVRLDSGSVRRQPTKLSRVIADAGVEGTLDAGAHGISLTVAQMDCEVEVVADEQVLAGALANLVQNAVKFTKAGGHVSLAVRIVGTHVEIDVEDQCGGLASGEAEGLFGAFNRRSNDRSGLGLGLFISRKGIEACGGAIRVRDRPGVGCVFTINLPRIELAS